MSVYKKKNSPFWHYDFELKGHRFFGSSKSESRAEAKNIEAAIRAQAVRGEHFPKSEKITLDIAAGDYWAQVGQFDAKPETTKYRMGNLTRIIGKDTLISEINTRVVSDFVIRRRGEPSQYKRPLSPSTVNREVELLRRVLYRSRDVADAQIGKVDWKRAKLHEADARSRTLSQDEEDRLYQELAGHLKPPFRFSMLTGIRLANCLTLDWSQVDFTAMEIRFMIKSKKHGGKVHILPMTKDTRAVLADLNPATKGPVFTFKGRPVKSWKTAWYAALRRAEIEGFRWHDIRHTAGTRMVQAGVDISVVQDVLGHENITTTRRYVNHQTDAKRAALEKLSRRIPEPKIRKKRKALKSNG